MTREHTALVLAGGGSLGAVQVGMLQALVHAGIEFDRVVGSSVGAINGAYFACRPDRAGVDALAEIWCRLDRSDVFPLSWSAAIRGMLRGGTHLLGNDALGRMIDSALAVERIEDSALPLHVVTTDVLSGLEVVHSRGVLRDALLASAAIPLVFPQVEIDGRLLMDGGVASNTPISSAAGLGARRIVVLPTGFGCACREAPRSLVALALHTLNLVSMRQIVRDIELVADRARIHVSPPLCPLGVSVFDFSRTRELLERARDQTDQWLADGGLERSEVPGALRAHLHDAQA